MCPSMHSKQQHSQMQVLNDILIYISWHCTLSLPAAHNGPASQQSFGACHTQPMNQQFLHTLIQAYAAQCTRDVGHAYAAEHSVLDA